MRLPAHQGNEHHQTAYNDHSTEENEDKVEKPIDETVEMWVAIFLWTSSTDFKIRLGTVHPVAHSYEPRCQEKVEENIYPSDDSMSFWHSGIWESSESVDKVYHVAQHNYAACHDDTNRDHFLNWTIVEIFSPNNNHHNGDGNNDNQDNGPHDGSQEKGKECQTEIAASNIFLFCSLDLCQEWLGCIRYFWFISWSLPCWCSFNGLIAWFRNPLLARHEAICTLIHDVGSRDVLSQLLFEILEFLKNMNSIHLHTYVPNFWLPIDVFSSVNIY